MDSTVYGPMMTENAEFAFVYSKGLLLRWSWAARVVTLERRTGTA